MNNYTKVLEFFMENNIQLNSNQIEELKDICNEADDNKSISNINSNFKRD